MTPLSKVYLNKETLPKGVDGVADVTTSLLLVKNMNSISVFVTPSSSFSLH